MKRRWRQARSEWLKIPCDEECSLAAAAFLWFKTGKTADCYSGGTRL
ncbi:MAG: hypothetical protein ACLR8P_20410 [Clostridium fessum]